MTFLEKCRIFLLDGVFGEYLCNKLMVKAEVNVKKSR